MIHEDWFARKGIFEKCSVKFRNENCDFKSSYYGNDVVRFKHM